MMDDERILFRLSRTNHNAIIVSDFMYLYYDIDMVVSFLETEIYISLKSNDKSILENYFYGEGCHYDIFTGKEFVSNGKYSIPL